jgi:hypothetical protein
MSKTSISTPNPRIPLRAKVVLALAWTLVMFQVALGGLLGVGFIPLAPLVLFGGACLLASAHEYAANAALAVRGKAPEKKVRAQALRVQTPAVS